MKLYYKIELRILSLKGQRNDELDYETICYNDGYIIIIDNEIKGFLTDDYIVGKISEKSLNLEVISNGTIQYLCLESNFQEEIIFPGEYYVHGSINSKEEILAKIKFVEKISNLSKIEDIDSHLNEVKEIYKIP